MTLLLQVMIDDVGDVFSHFTHFNSYFTWSAFPW